MSVGSRRPQWPGALRKLQVPHIASEINHAPHPKGRRCRLWGFPYVYTYRRWRTYNDQIQRCKTWACFQGQPTTPLHLDLCSALRDLSAIDEFLITDWQQILFSIQWTAVAWAMSTLYIEVCVSLRVWCGGEIRLIIFFFYYASLLFILFPLLAKWLLFEWNLCASYSNNSKTVV